MLTQQQIDAIEALRTGAVNMRYIWPQTRPLLDRTIRRLTSARDEIASSYAENGPIIADLSALLSEQAPEGTMQEQIGKLTAVSAKLTQALIALAASVQDMTEMLAVLQGPIPANVAAFRDTIDASLPLLQADPEPEPEP